MTTEARQPASAADLAARAEQTAAAQQDAWRATAQIALQAGDCDIAHRRLRNAVIAAVTHHGVSQAAAARAAGVDRGTVRAWLGKGR